MIWSNLIKKFCEFFLCLFRLFSWIIGEKPQWFFRIWNSTHIATLKSHPEIFSLSLQWIWSTKHWKPSSLYAFKRNRAIVFQRETFPQLLLSSGNSLRSRIHPDSLLLGLQGVFEAHHLLETVPSFLFFTVYVSPYRCNQILEIKGLSLYAFVLNSQCIFPFL